MRIKDISWFSVVGWVLWGIIASSLVWCIYTYSIWESWLS